MRATDSIARLRTESHIAALDGLRGMAILAVVFHHYTQNISHGRIDRFVTFWTYGGWVGVDLFFVLSGFLITGILLDSKNHPNYFRNFFSRRALRIWPLYYLLLVISLIVAPLTFGFFEWRLTPSAIPEGLYLLYMTNVGIALNGDWGNATLGHLEITWSLAIEEQFYLTWPFVVCLLGHRRLMAACVGLVVIAFAARVALLMADAPRVAIYVLPFTRMDGLAAGSLIALLARSFVSWETLYRWACRLTGAFAIGIVALALYIGGFRETNVLMQSMGYTMLVLGFSSLLVVVLGAPRHSGITRVCELSWLRILGRFSYALYLSHIPVKTVIEPWFYRPEPVLRIGNSIVPTQIMFTATGLVLSLLVSWISWHLIEKHFLKLKRHFAYASRLEAVTVFDAPNTRVERSKQLAPSSVVG